MDFNMKDLLYLFYEVGYLKRVPRSGWALIGVEKPESVAEHCHRTAFIAYFLAEYHQANKERCLLMALLHDFPETRMNDPNKVTASYIDKDEIEEKVISDQVLLFPEQMKNPFIALLKEYQTRDETQTIEAKIVRDANLIDCALQAKEYVANGNVSAKLWIDRIEEKIDLDISKKIVKDLLDLDPYEWFIKLKAP